MGKKQQENLIVIFLSPINVDEQVSTKITTFRIDKGGHVGHKSISGTCRVSCQKPLIPVLKI